MDSGRYFAKDDINLQGHHLVDWKWLDDIPSSGASDGHVISFIDGKVQWAAVTSEGVASISYNDLDDVPTEFPPEDHTHVLADITDYSASPSITAGTNIEVTGGTVAVTSSPSFDGIVEANTYTVNGVDMSKFNVCMHLDGGGAALREGTLVQFRMPADAELVEVSGFSDVADVCTFLIESCTYGGYDTFSDVTGGLDFTLVGVKKFSKTTLSSWTTDFDEGDIVRVTVDTSDTAQIYATIVMDFIRGG